MPQAEKALVIGASGFLGSHLVKELAKQGYKVRILARKSSNLEAIAGIDYEKCIGDVMDQESLQKAMAGCDWVFHSAVDTRAWLFNSAPLYETNVLGVINSVNAAKAANVKKFILTSSLITIGRSKNGDLADETCFPKNNEFFTDYMRTRFLAEKYMLDAFRQEGFPAVSCCVANTYGPADIQPTPHGNLIKQVALGRVPVYLNAKAEMVGVQDAAQGLILAAQKGKPGERYIISEKYLSNKELFSLAAEYAGVKKPFCAVPTPLVYLATTLIGMGARLFAADCQLTNNSAKLMYRTWPLSHQKAMDELGWKPRPVEESIKEAIESYLGS